MKALAIVPGAKTIKMVERTKPTLARADGIEVRVVRVGICGTDREEVGGGRARAPDGQTALVLNDGDGTVTVIDLKSKTVRNTFKGGTGIETASYY